jgi:hypothetical protein
MQSRDEQISLGAAMIAIAVAAVIIAVILALREEPLVADPPYVPRARPPAKLREKLNRPILIARPDVRPYRNVQHQLGRDARPKPGLPPSSFAS